MTKSYEAFVQELPKQSLVILEGNFSIPTAKQEILFQRVAYEAQERDADHLIFLKDKQALKINEKLFPLNNFVQDDEDHSFLKECKDRYSQFYFVASEANENVESDSIEYIQVDESYFNEDDLKEIALSGDLEAFKGKMHSGVREIDALAMMNEIRFENGELPIKQQTEENKIREAYLRGDILQIGEAVDYGGTIYDIIARYENRIGLKNRESGETTTKFVKDLVSKDWKEIDSDNFKHFNPDDPKAVAELSSNMVEGNEAEFAKMCNEGRPWLIDVLKKKRGMKIEALEDVNVHNPDDIEKLIQFTKLTGAFPTIDEILVSSVLGIKGPSLKADVENL